MTACDTCPQPGHCCRSIRLNGGAFAIDEDTIDGAIGAIAEVNIRRVGTTQKPIPFMPLFKMTGERKGWLWWCPNLSTKTGRCDDYENRPEACTDYEPGHDGLCVLYEGEK